MKINIVSNDSRYFIVNQFLTSEGYDSNICTLENCEECDVLVFSVRFEIDDDNLKALLSRLDEKTLVLCGNNKTIFESFCGKAIDYSRNDIFVQKNAHLTAEGTISYLHSLTKESLLGKKVFVCGYGRIGKALCVLLEALGATVYSYARRQEAIKEMTDNGIIYLPYEKGRICDIIINTVPQNIFTKSIIDKIPKNRVLVDLASPPYGFEDMSRVNVAGGIPGRILPISGAGVIFDTIKSILSLNGKEYSK